MSFKVDYVIRGGRVIDPYNHLDNILSDVAIHDGRIVSIGQDLPQGQKEVSAEIALIKQILML